MDIKTIKLIGQHVCDKSLHESLEKKIFRELCIEAASDANGEVGPESIYTEISEQ